MDLVLIGVQGSGKGTQANLIAKKYKKLVFKTGDFLRNISKENSPLGQKIKIIINQGKLVPKEIIQKMLNDFLEKMPKNQSIIFEGIPRNITQKVFFDKKMKEMGREFIVVEIAIDKEKTIQRIIKRAKEENREDDNETVINNRFANYEKHTVPVIEAYKKENKMIVINGDQSIDKVNAESEEKLKNYF